MTDDKRPVGRPSKYTPELLAECHQYLKDYNTFPSIAGLAVRLKVSRDTLHTWAKEEDKIEFSDIYTQLLALQEDELLRNGLMGHWNASMAKMVLTKHGYSDKVDATSSDGSMTPTSQPVTIRLVGPDE